MKPTYLLSYGVMVLLLSSCLAYNMKGRPLEHCIDLENAQLYIRKQYSGKAPQGGQELKVTQDTTMTENSKLSELQYLLVSGDQVIYIAATPTRSSYEDEGSYIIDGSHPNAHYLEAFYFGKITTIPGKATITFENKQYRQEWDLERKSDGSLELLCVDESKLKSGAVTSVTSMKVRYAFEAGLHFNAIPGPFSFGFKEPYKRGEYLDLLQNKTNNKTVQKEFLRSSKICFNFKKGKKRQQELECLKIPFRDSLVLLFHPDRVPFFRDDLVGNRN